MPRRRPRVAIVDDDDLVRAALGNLLAVAGLDVEAFASGPEFLASDRQPPGCLIVDYQMPAMNGLDLVSALRRRGVAVPAILVTGRPDEELRGRAAQLGIAAVLQKPVSGDRLLKFVAAALHDTR
jgi:two-component system, LuxR family, response regulator FixJ